MPSTVLNVDDNDTSRYLRTRALQTAGYHIVEAADGQQALSVAASTDLDAVLLDVRLPGMDGFHVARHLRESDKTKDIPIIFISAAERAFHVQAEALDQGADAYLVEPVHPDVLVSTIGAAVRHRGVERQLRQELEQRHLAEMRLRVAMAAAELGTWDLHLEANIVTASESTDRLFGLPHSGSRPFLDYLNRIHPEDREQVRAALGAAAGQSGYAAEFRVMEETGGTRWLLSRGEVRRDGAGQPQRLIGAVIDITARQQADASVRIHSKLLAAVGEAVVATDAAGNINYWGAAAEKLYGWTAGEVLGRNVVDVVPSDISRTDAAAIMARLAAGERWSGEFQVRRKDGQAFWATVNDVPILDAAGTVTGIIGVSTDISARKALEQQIRASEERFRLLAENSKDLVARLDERGVPEYLSPSYETVLGHSRSGLMALLARDPLWLLHPEDRPAYENAQRTLAECGEWRLSYRLRCQDGQYIWVEGLGKRVAGSDGASPHVHTFCRDITQRVEMENELKAAVAEHRRYHKMLEALMEFIPEGITIADAPDARIRWVSKHGRELTGRPLTEIEGISVGEHSLRWGLYRADGVTPASDEELPLTRATTSGEVVTDEEWILQRPDGSRIWILCNAGPILDESGRLAGGVIAWRDVTERKAEQARVAENEARLQLALDSAHLGLWECDLLTGSVRASERAHEMFGMTTEEASRDSWFRCVHPQDRGRVAAELDAALAGLRRYDTEFRIGAGTEWRWLRSAATLIRVSDSTLKFVGIVEDITDRKQAQEALRSSEERLSLAQTAGGIGTWDVDLVTGNVVWSPGMCILWGLGPPGLNLTVEGALARIHEEDRESVRASFNAAVAGGKPYTAEFRITLPNGDVRWIAGKADAQFDAQGRPVRMLGVNYDITARKTAEDALVRSNEELQQFAFAMSHDLQEPLRTVTSFSELLRRRYQSRLEKDGAEFLDAMAAAARRMHQMIQDLLAYSRVVHHERAADDPVDLKAVLDWTVSNLQSSMTETGTQVLSDDLPVVCGDFARLSQLLQNLIGNAIKYRLPHVPPIVRIWASVSGNDCVVSVEDNGPGIPREHAEKVFLPFKRLHGSEVSGTGLGLAICQRIVESLGGRIWADRSSMDGAAFRFTLRLAPGAAKFGAGSTS